jgi:hypothetical protein
MRPTRQRLAGLAAVAMLALAMTALAGPVLGKGDIEARLVAPIARDTPGGTTLVVRMLVTMPDGDTNRPVRGTPMYVTLVGRDGTQSREVARDGSAGVYTARVEVPASGIASVEIGIQGSTDLPVRVVGPELVAGNVTADTAQIAPVIAAAGAPLARASAVAPPAVAPAITPTSPSAADVAPVVLLVGIAALAVGFGLGTAGVRRTRSAARLRVSGRSPEA